MVEPYFKTKPEDYSKEERIKLKTKGLREDSLGIYEDLRDNSKDNLEEEIASIVKSFGIYMEFNRDKVKHQGHSQKEWIYMIRIAIPGGGPINSQQWRILDEISNKYTVSDAYTGTPQPSLKLTTRQDIQLHHVKKKDLVNTIKEIATSGFFTLNGCGDNVRNTIACPLSYYSKIFNANELAKKIASYFRLPTQVYIQVFEIDPEYSRLLDERPINSFEYAENLLNRKFKIGIAGLLPNGKIDNCVEVRANDVGIVPFLEHGKLKYQIYVGGSMGESNAYPTFSALAVPIGTVDEEMELIRAVDAIARVHQEWGDRKNRHWARIKYLVYKMGVNWLREKIKEYSGIELLPPKLDLDLSNRDLHLDWIKLDNGKYALGIFIENGRLIDGPNGKMKSAIRYIMDKYEEYGLVLFITPNQHLILSNIPEELTRRIEEDLRSFGYGFRYGKPYSKIRINSISCVGFPTCKLSYTDSERFLPKLIDSIETRLEFEDFSIGVSGCMAQCSRPATRAIAWVGTGYNLYMLKLGGDENRAGEPLIDWETQELYLYQVPAEKVNEVTIELVKFYLTQRREGERISDFFRRVGNKRVIDYLKSNEKFKDLMRPYRVPAKVQGYYELHELEKRIVEELQILSVKVIG